MNDMAPNKPPVVRISSWGWTMTGDQRISNEDNFLNWPDFFLWAVADGVGGQDKGEWASRIVIEKLLQMDMKPDLIQQMHLTSSCLKEANAKLWRQKIRGFNCASTIALLFMREGKGCCFWCGDSRCYLLRRGTLYQCSRDHTLRQQHIDNNNLSVPEAMRMIKHNIITKAIGAQEQVDFEQVEFDIEPGDKFLLCTDGLSSLLTAENIAEVLGKSIDARSAAIRFENFVKNRRQPDNITQISIFVSDVDLNY